MSATSTPRPIRIAEHRSRHGPRPALPDDRPGLVEIGPFAIRWYALAYITGLLLGWRYVRHLSDLPPRIMTREHVDDLLVWVTLGVIVGGRLGYVLFRRKSTRLNSRH